MPPLTQCLAVAISIKGQRKCARPAHLLCAENAKQTLELWPASARRVRCPDSVSRGQQQLGKCPRVPWAAFAAAAAAACI